jgi:hypothetical protein
VKGTAVYAIAKFAFGVVGNGFVKGQIQPFFALQLVADQT